MLMMNTGFVFGQQDDQKPPEWILSYAIVGLTIGLGIIVVVRSSKRKDSVISEYERRRIQEEALKNSGKH